jgi:hypothetical protein
MREALTTKNVYVCQVNKINPNKLKKFMSPAVTRIVKHVKREQIFTILKDYSNIFVGSSQILRVSCL